MWRNRTLALAVVVAFLALLRLVAPEPAQRAVWVYLVAFPLGYGHVVGAAVFARSRHQRPREPGLARLLRSAFVGSSALTLFAAYAWTLRSPSLQPFVLTPILLLFAWHIVENDLALSRAYRNEMRLGPVARAPSQHALALAVAAGVGLLAFSTREGALFSRVYFGGALVPVQAWLTLDELSAAFVLYHTLSWLLYFEDRVRGSAADLGARGGAAPATGALVSPGSARGERGALPLGARGASLFRGAGDLLLLVGGALAPHGGRAWGRAAAGARVSLALLQPVAWSAAFWIALFVYRGARRRPRPLRFACALGLGALLAHAGWLLLHARSIWPALRARPGLLLDPSLGFCVLFLPLGLLLLERSAAAFASLPLALAVARLGCLAAGCCLGTPTSAPWALAGLHPTALYEVAGLLALHVAAARTDPRFAAPLVLGGIGALRLAIDPLRAAPPLGAPVLPPAAIAAAWLVLAAALAWRRRGPLVSFATRQRDTEHDSRRDGAVGSSPSREIPI